MDEEDIGTGVRRKRAGKPSFSSSLFTLRSSLFSRSPRPPRFSLFILQYSLFISSSCVDGAGEGHLRPKALPGGSLAIWCLVQLVLHSILQAQLKGLRADPFVLRKRGAKQVSQPPAVSRARSMLTAGRKHRRSRSPSRLAYNRSEKAPAPWIYARTVVVLGKCV